MESRVLSRQGLTLVEVLVVVGIIGILGSILLPVLSRARESGRRSACANNLKQMSIALKMYAGESVGGRYPRKAFHFGDLVNCDDSALPVTGEPEALSVLFWNPDAMYPEYISDVKLLGCPSDRSYDEDALVNPNTGLPEATFKCSNFGRGWPNLDVSYAYWGHVLDKLDDVPGWTLPKEVYSEISELPCSTVSSGHPVSAQIAMALEYLFDVAPWDRPQREDSDYDLSDYAGLVSGPLGNGDTNTLYRLREGIERILVTDVNNPGASAVAQSQIPLMWDQVSELPAPLDFNHVPGGANVLFLDGHVEFRTYPGPGTVSRAYAAFSGCLL